MKKLSTIILFLFFNLFSYGQTNNASSISQKNSKTDSIENNEDDDDVFVLAAKMPRFNNKEGFSGFTEFVAKNLKYPQEAANNGIQGKVFVQFIVDKTGKVTNAAILRGVHELLDNEALRVVNLSLNWEPGKQDGMPVRVRLVFPITFQLQEFPMHTQETKTNLKPADSLITESDSMENDSVYKKVDEMPRFNNKEGMDGFLQYILRKVQYPVKAIDNGIQGIVYVQFIINKQGKLTNAKVIQSVHESIDNEALRVVNSSPTWKPGKHQGKVVNVQYTMPIKFSMQY